MLGGKENEKALDAEAGVNLGSHSDLLVLLLISLAVDKFTAEEVVGDGLGKSE